MLRGGHGETGPAAFASLNIGGRPFKADPHPWFARMRAEAPVCRVRTTDREPAWVVTRFDDVVAVLRDERFVKRRRAAMTPDQVRREPWMPAAFRPLERNMLDLDPPDHTRLRALVQKSFTPRLIEDLRGRVVALTQDLLHSARRRGHIDLIRQFALPLPSIIIAELLGVPPRDQHRFHRWSSAMVTTPATTFGKLRLMPPILAFLRYMRKLIAARSAEPTDDLISSLVMARESDDALSEDELLAMLVLLLIAGHETTVNLIGNGTLALLRHPDQLARLRDDPELIRPAIEEMLRYDGPLLMATERFPNEDVSIAGVTIPRGERVFAALASANRDPAQFADPDRLDLSRQPNRHIAFGLGVHFCLGAPLARLEGQVAIQALAQLPELHLTIPAGELRRRPGLLLNSLESLPIDLGGRRSRAAREG